MFRWLDPVLHPEQQSITTPSKGGNKAGLVCPGESCRVRTKPNRGNRNCSNGTLCSDCCYRVQNDGRPQCLYPQHNYKREADKVRPLSNLKNVSLTYPQQRRREGIGSALSLSGPPDPFLTRETTGGSSISPYHQAAGRSFSRVRSERVEGNEGIRFQVAWHFPVRRKCVLPQLSNQREIRQ